MSHHWLSPYSNNTPCLLHVCCDVTTVKPWQFLSSHQLRKEGVNRESPGMRLSLIWTVQQKDVDLASSQVLQKFLRRKGWTDIYNCCPYIPRLVPNTCGFRVTSVIKYSLTVSEIFTESLRYSWAMNLLMHWHTGTRDQAIFSNVSSHSLVSPKVALLPGLPLFEGFHCSIKYTGV